MLNVLYLFVDCFHCMFYCSIVYICCRRVSSIFHVIQTMSDINLDDDDDDDDVKYLAS